MSNSESKEEQVSGARRLVRTGESYPEIQYRVKPKVIRSAKPGKQEKLNSLLDYLQAVCDEPFTGYIKINFTQGSVDRIERFEEILKS